jgi:prepilin-type N-terminal cleavage/methylation domain-containing protein
MNTPSPRRGFTLIELLVVVAIIGLLLAILLPSLSRAREQGKIAACLANLKAIGMAAATYETDHKKADYPWALHPYYQAGGKVYAKWGYYTEFIYGGGMPDYDQVATGWPYGAKSNPAKNNADVFILPPLYRPMNPYFAPEVSWNRFSAKASIDPTPFEENLPGTFKCPSDSSAAVPDVGAAETEFSEDLTVPTWKFWGSSYPINWYWAYYYTDVAAGGTGKKAEEGMKPPYTNVINVLGAGGTGLGASFKPGPPGLGRKMLNRNAVGGWESKFVMFYENRVNEALEGARPRNKDGTPISTYGKNLVGWHRQHNKHSVLMRDGHAAYLTMDTRFIDGLGWTTWPNRPWKDDWAEFTGY